MPQNNGTVKRIIAGVATAVILILITAVLANQNRITANEVRIENICDMVTALRSEVERNRTEQREEYRAITAKLDEIAKEIRTK